VVLACRPSPAGDVAHGTKGDMHRVRSRRDHRAWWHAGQRTGGARPTMRSCRRAPGGLRGGAEQGEAEWHSTRQRRGGEAEKNRRRWRVPIGGELRWPTAPVGRPYSTRGPRRGEGRSAMRTRVVGGVSSI
jgi:hypothetical protein